MTRNVTLRMREDLLTELRHRAVDARMSLSGWITAVLEDRLQRDKNLEGARRRVLKRLEEGFRLGGEPAAREDLHAR